MLVYTYSRIDVNTTIQLYINIAIRLYVAYYLTLSIFSIFVSRFDLTFSSDYSHHRLLFCKGIVGKEHGKHRSSLLLAENFS